MVFPLLLSLIFSTLGLIHWNWVFGGQFGFAQAIPTKENGERVLNPGRVDSAIVGLGLLAFAAFYLLISGLITIELPKWILSNVPWIIPTIFSLRAMGDFRYVGFFKRINQTEFARMDTKLFSPLCLFIGLIGFAIAWFR